MNRNEPLSLYAQLFSGISVDRSFGEWIDILVEDKRASVPDQVAAKLDVRGWFSTLTSRMKEIAADLAIGCSTKRWLKSIELLRASESVAEIAAGFLECVSRGSGWGVS